MIGDGAAKPAETQPAAGAGSFADVQSGDYFANAVTWAVSHEITNGMSETSFAPAGTVTRAQAVTFLWRSQGNPEPTSSANAFSDVPADTWYTKAVLWAVEKNITNGVGGGRFDPNASVTRGQMLTFLARAAGVDAYGDNWQENTNAWAAEKKLSDGIPGTLSSADNCPRCDVVYYLWKQLAK